MKLISLNLKNFRQHADSRIQFADGLTGIIGNNGAGKSTVVEALAFALYGSRALRGKVDDVRTFGLPSNAITSAELVFNSEGENYRIYRDLVTAELYIGGQSNYIVSGNKAVAQRVVEILGLSLDEFLASYYTEQKSLEFLSGKKGTAEREKFITRMIGYDRLEKIQITLREERRDLRNLVSGLTASLGDLNFIENRIKSEEASLKKLKILEQDAIKVLSQADLSNKIAQEELKNYEILQKKYFHTTQQIALAQNSKQLIKNKVADLITQNKKLSTDLQLALGASFDLELLRIELSELQSQVLEFQNSILGYNLQLQEEHNQKQSLLSQKNADLAVLKSQISQIDKKLGALKKLQSGSECPTCGQLLGAEFQTVAKQLEKEKLEHANLLLLKESEIQFIKQEQRKETQLNQQIVDLKLLLNKQQGRLTTLQGSQREILKLQNNQQELLKLTAEVEIFEQKLVELEKEATQLGFLENVYLKVRANAESGITLLSATRLQKVRNEGEIREVEAMLARSKQELLEYQLKNADLTTRRKELITLDQADQVLGDFRKNLNSTIRPRLAELASSYLAELSDGRYSNVIIAEDFSPIIYEDGITKSILSGGEEDLLDLCLRLALSSLITERAGQNLSFLILDEVFGSLDENRRANVLTLLEKLQSRFEQILLITHLDDIKDGVANLLEINFDDASGTITIQNDRFNEII